MTDETTEQPAEPETVTIMVPEGQALTTIMVIAEPTHIGPDGNLKISVGDESVKDNIPALMVWDGAAKAWLAIFLPAGMSWTLQPMVAPGLWRPGMPERPN